MSLRVCGFRVRSKLDKNRMDLSFSRGPFSPIDTSVFYMLPTRFATADATASTIPFFHSLGFGMTTATSSKSMQMCECVCNRERDSEEGGRWRALLEMSKLGLFCGNPLISLFVPWKGCPQNIEMSVFPNVCVFVTMRVTSADTCGPADDTHWWITAVATDITRENVQKQLVHILLSLLIKQNSET